VKILVQSQTCTALNNAIVAYHSHCKTEWLISVPQSDWLNSVPKILSRVTKSMQDTQSNPQLGLPYEANKLPKLQPAMLDCEH